MNWKKKGIHINRDKLKNLKYTDNIILISENSAELQEMITDLKQKSEEVGQLIWIKQRLCLEIGTTANRKQK